MSIRSASVPVLPTPASAPVAMFRMYRYAVPPSEELTYQVPVVGSTVIPVKVREQTWRIPQSDVVDVISPTPRISDETRQRITTLIRELGNVEWEERQAASDELSEYGYMAKGLLIESLRLTPDAEVRHRIDLLLNEMP